MSDESRELLRARPEQLQEVIDALPPTKGSRTRARRPISQLRSQLLERSVEQLRQQRMTHKAREVLPYLAVETRNPELRERIVALTIQQVREMRWPLLAQMLPYLWEEEELRSSARTRAQTDPPVSGPRWLTHHWEAALGAAHPPTALAREGLAVEPILGRLLSHLELRDGSPLGQAVLNAALDLADETWLGEQPYTETLRTIENSTAAPEIRMRLLAMILDRYVGEARSWQIFNGGPMVELMTVCRSILRGWPHERPGAWRRMPTIARRVGHWMHHREQLDALYPYDRPDTLGVGRAWRSLIPWVDQMWTDPSSQIFAMQIGKTVYVEHLSSPQRCAIYRRTGWWRIWRQHTSTAPRSPLPESDDILERGPGWRTDFDLRLIREHGLPTDLDSLTFSD